MSVRITVDGEQIDGRDGQSLAGVMLGSGMLSWRDSPTGRRGIFCGIGMCQDCVVTVNGVPGVRACQRDAVDGDAVESEERA